MNYEYLNYFIPSLFEEHIKIIMENGPPNSNSSFNKVLTIQEKEYILDELYRTKYAFIVQYLNIYKDQINIDWIYNQKDLLDSLISYLNKKYRNQNIYFWIDNNEVILRKYYVDRGAISPLDVLTYYLFIKYKYQIDTLAEDYFDSLILIK